MAADILNPILSAQFNLKGFMLALQFGGNEAVIERSMREIVGFLRRSGTRPGAVPRRRQRFWTAVAP